MNDEHGHVAMPKLYGAPAYARPPASPVARAERPFDPDDLPLESERTSEDLEAVADAVGGGDSGPTTGDGSAGGASAATGADRSFRLRLPRIGRPGTEPSQPPMGE